MNNIKISFGYSELLLISATIVYLSELNFKFSFILFAASMVGSVAKYSLEQELKNSEISFRKAILEKAKDFEKNKQ